MIRNGVLDARQQFAERRYLADANREFDRIKADVIERFGIDIEFSRTCYLDNAGKIFAVFSDVLVDTFSRPPSVTRWGRR